MFFICLTALFTSCITWWFHFPFDASSCFQNRISHLLIWAIASISPLLVSSSDWVLFSFLTLLVAEPVMQSFSQTSHSRSSLWAFKSCSCRNFLGHQPSFCSAASSLQGSPWTLSFQLIACSFLVLMPVCTLFDRVLLTRHFSCNSDSSGDWLVPLRTSSLWYVVSWIHVAVSFEFLNLLLSSSTLSASYRDGITDRGLRILIFILRFFCQSLQHYQLSR